MGALNEQHLILCSGQFFLTAGEISWGGGEHTLCSKYNIKMFESVMESFDESENKAIIQTG